MSWTSLHFAARNGDLVVTKEIVAAGHVDLHARELTGKTALFFASKWGHADVAQFLMEAKADAGAIDHRGRTPLDYAGNAATELVLLQVPERDHEMEHRKEEQALRARMAREKQESINNRIRDFHEYKQEELRLDSTAATRYKREQTKSRRCVNCHMMFQRATNKPGHCAHNGAWRDGAYWTCCNVRAAKSDCPQSGSHVEGPENR
mmetsp:Transcript_9229/g.21133  ORF Transcript_9229/g.21133 Transcript_9229/m.21133 type:complete len:206 (-) Transcript_9229:267-884(-)